MMINKIIRWKCFFVVFMIGIRNKFWWLIIICIIKIIFLDIKKKIMYLFLIFFRFMGEKKEFMVKLYV